MNYHDFFFYSIPLGTQVVNLSLLSQAVITRLVVLSGYLPLAGLIPVMHGVINVTQEARERKFNIFARAFLNCLIWLEVKNGILCVLVNNLALTGRYAQIVIVSSVSPDSQAKRCCQNDETQVLNTLQYGTSKGVDKICSL